MTADPEFTTIRTEEEAASFRPGHIVTLKGKLEAVRYGRGAGRSRIDMARSGPLDSDPSLVVTFADWSMLAASVDDRSLARSICISLSTYVGVKCEVLEDAELRALAIWELGGGAVIPLGSPTTVPEVL